MAFSNSHEAAGAIAELIGGPTPRQRQLAELCGITLERDCPTLVAAAKLRMALTVELNLRTADYVSEELENLVEQLRTSDDVTVSYESNEEALAWIAHFRLKRRREHLLELELRHGDIVMTWSGEIAEVSSIGQNGRVFFKGGRGFGAWPDLIKVRARKEDESGEAKELRIQAKNKAEKRKGPSEWSAAKSGDLAHFVTECGLTEVEVDELEAVIENASDERPIQKFLESHPHLITSLMSGNERYCIPQKRLGGEYIPDFIIGDADSLGFRWVLIEIETPRSGIYLQKGEDLDQYARKGYSQIVSWRNWLCNNFAYARNSPRQDGLGLFDIREKSDAVVLVGRREKMPPTKDAQRSEIRQSNNIQIHTYDWLIETLRGIVRHTGPPGSNRYLFD
ncbi:hypothetical protein HNR65_002130 [Desulfosalsimonas propionicica]|uniref:Shedu protein SduA C-terminal domain-containing protein n=1 Tax=Desulfosalsimonas propionicica TaxID=332175 RepID=A0A7W0C9Z0_9BACT|nr:Shedu anti-phage system protein SduA domain-containing protein [Desulfosalsimonas propionicica]MBA2881799.1 hypothetical protein [Desulfosalsimonas propionicica]